MCQPSRQGIPLFPFYLPNYCYEWNPLELLSWAWIWGGRGVGTHEKFAIFYLLWPWLLPGSSTARWLFPRLLSFLKLNPSPPTLPRNHLNSQGWSKLTCPLATPCLLHATGTIGEEAENSHISFTLTKGSPRQGNQSLGNLSGQLNSSDTGQAWARILPPKYFTV